MGVWERPDAAYAYRLVRYLVGDLICAVKEMVSESPYEKAKKRILQIVALAGRGGISRNDLTRKTQFIRVIQAKFVNETSTIRQNPSKFVKGF